MFKIFKQNVQIGQNDQGHGVESSVYETHNLTNKQTNWLTIPSMIAGAVVGVMMFSVFFAIILIPLGIFGIRAWRRFRKLKENGYDQTIEAEYTVISKRADVGEDKD